MLSRLVYTALDNPCVPNGTKGVTTAVVVTRAVCVHAIAPRTTVSMFRFQNGGALRPGAWTLTEEFFVFFQTYVHDRAW